MIATNALGHDRAVDRPEHGQRVRARWPRSSIAPRRALQHDTEIDQARPQDRCRARWAAALVSAFQLCGGSGVRSQPRFAVAINVQALRGAI
jgi:hypothetical protein